MTQFLAPGVRFTEKFGVGASFPITVNDGTVGIAAVTEKGPVGIPVRVTSLAEARDVFGLNPNYELYYWLTAFFGESDGVGEVWVTRVVHYTDVTDAATKTSGQSEVTLSNGGPGYSISGASPATATSAAITDMKVQLSAADGESAQTISISAALTTGAAIAAAIQAAVRALTPDVGGNAADFSGFTCVFTDDGKYLLTNGSVGATKTVAVTDGVANNMADDLKLGTLNGGTEVAVPNGMTVSAINDGLWGDALAVSTSLSQKISTTLVSDAGDGDTSLVVRRSAGIVPGTILKVVDNTAPANATLYVEVDRVENNRVYLTEALSLTQTIEGTGVTPASVQSLDFDLSVYKSGVRVEFFPYLSANPNNADDYFVTRINGDGTSANSKYISVEDLSPPTTQQYARPAAVVESALSGGVDGLTGLDETDFIGDQTAKTGIEAFQDVEDINFLVVPDSPVAATHAAMISMAERLQRFEVICDFPQSLDADGAVAHVQDNDLYSDYVSHYWPNIYMTDPTRRSRTRVVAASAYILGMRARNAATPGVTISRPPAGQKFASRVAVDVEDRSTYQEAVQEQLLQARINPIGGWQGTSGIFALGSYTALPGGVGEGVGEVQGRALILKIRRELRTILRSFLLSEYASEDTLKAIQQTVEGYLETLRRNKYIVGNTPAEAYYANFTPSLNPTAQLYAGWIKGVVGVRIGRGTKKIDIELNEHIPGLAQAA